MVALSSAPADISVLMPAAGADRSAYNKPHGVAPTRTIISDTRHTQQRVPNGNGMVEGRASEG